MTPLGMVVLPLRIMASASAAVMTFFMFVRVLDGKK
jgi:hypothetical protein